MAKQSLNLGNLINAATSRVSEALEETQQHSNAATQVATQSATQVTSQPATQVTVPQPTQVTSPQTTQVTDNSETYPSPVSCDASQEQASPTSRRRSTIPRTNGCTYYLSSTHMDAIDRIKCFNKVDKQDIVRTALDLFLAKYMKPDGLGLTDDGVGEIRRYISTIE